MLISGASSALDFTLSKLKNQYDISNTEQRVQYLTKACDVLAELHNPIRQDVYSRRLAQETATDKSAILEMINRKVRSLRRKGRQKAGERNIKFRRRRKNKGGLQAKGQHNAESLCATADNMRHSKRQYPLSGNCPKIKAGKFHGYGHEKRL